MAEENGVTGDIVTCPTCQKIWPHDTKFCTQCGTWIQSGKVIEPGAAPGAAGEPSIGASPPGIRPPDAGAGPSPPSIRPQGPRVGSAPPGTRRPDAGVGPSPPGIAPQQPAAGAPPPGLGPQHPGAAPGQVPGAPGAPVEGAPEGGPPARKYALKVEPHREEHVPAGPMFIPKREAPKAKTFGARQVLIVIVCVLVIGYAVISMAFKPLHGFLLGTLFDTIGKPEMALKQYNKAAGGDSTWADKAEAAIEGIGKRAFAKHLDLQYHHSWTANSKIAFEIQGRSDPIELESNITYRAPGSVTENITGAAASGQRVIDDTGLTQRFASTRGQRLTADQYSQYMNTVLGFGPDTLFKETGKDDVIEAFYDQLQMRMSGLRDHGDEKVYSFTIAFEGDRNRMAKFAMLTGPFFPWNTAVPRTQIIEVTYLIRARDGCLVNVQYTDSNGTPAVTQTFDDFKPDSDGDD